MKISEDDKSNLIERLKERFADNMYRHEAISWEEVLEKLEKNPKKLLSLLKMEDTGREPDVVILDKDSKDIIFYDCSLESPKGRRSLCYDDEALESRNKNKPAGSAINLAKEMGVEILDEDTYRKLQEVFSFDKKSSSWVKTPEKIRKLGGSIFCDNRYETIFTYHNGAESYYSSRGFRSYLKL